LIQIIDDNLVFLTEKHDVFLIRYCDYDRGVSTASGAIGSLITGGSFARRRVDSDNCGIAGTTGGASVFQGPNDRVRGAKMGAAQAFRAGTRST